MQKILVVEDEKEIAEAIKIYLEEENFEVTICLDSSKAMDLLKQNDYKLILLDIMMPKLDGVTLARKFRTLSSIPIIFISAKSESTDKITGLNAGADDYITKPFEPLELIARVKANIRRYCRLGSNVSEDNLKIDGLEINNRTKEVFVDGEPIKLTPIEYKLLFFLATNKGKVFSIKQIYENVWKEPFDGYEKKVVVHISHIRDKIEINPKEPRYIKAVWGLGYKIENIK